MNMDFELLDVTEFGAGDELPAGDFAAWLQQTRAGAGADVPCGTCNACCRSSYFIHITPADTAALAHIPAVLLFPAPGLPEGHRVMGFSERGACPMLVDDKCSIYNHRPQTCRDYDCRVFAATGVAAGSAEKAAVNAQARRWRFTYPTADDQTQQAAVHAAIAFLQEHGDLLPRDIAPGNPTQIALLAIRVYAVFLAAPHTPAATVERITEIIAAG